MADKTTGELRAVKVETLPPAPDVYDDTLLPAEQQGEAVRISGKQFKDYAVVAGVEASKVFADSVAASASAATAAAATAKSDATKATTARQNAEAAATRAETARNSIVLDEAKINQKVSDASKSATAAKTSETNSAKSATDAEKAAARAQAEAERVSVPAAVGVYNVILTDRVTAERYALIVENGALAILGVANDLEATDMTLIDNATGTAYEVAVESGRIVLEEV